MEATEPGSDVVTLPCGHEYHFECIQPWLSTQRSCPVCRAEVTADALAAFKQSQTTKCSPCAPIPSDRNSAGVTDLKPSEVTDEAQGEGPSEIQTHIEDENK